MGKDGELLCKKMFSRFDDNEPGLSFKVQIISGVPKKWSRLLLPYFFVYNARNFDKIFIVKLGGSYYTHIYVFINVVFFVRLIIVWLISHTTIETPTKILNNRIVLTYPVILYIPCVKKTGNVMNDVKFFCDGDWLENNCVVFTIVLYSFQSERFKDFL